MKTRLSSLNPLLSIFLSFFVAVAITSCGGGGGSSDAASETNADTGNTDTGESSDSDKSSLLTGVFVDSAVGGVNYTTETQSDVTNEAGEFSYLQGENVTFSIGSITFPTIPAATQVSPVDMASGSANPSATTTNIARLLQSLDQDGNPDNGITIPQAATETVAAINFNVSADEFANNADVINLVANSGSINSELISAEDANSHLNRTLSASENSESNIVFSVGSLNNRFLIPTPEGFAVGQNAYRMNENIRLRVAGIVNGELLYGKFPWTVTEEAELQIDFSEFAEGVVRGYSVTSAGGEKIMLRVVTVDNDEEASSRDYYLSKPLSTSDFAGRKITIDNTNASVELLAEGDALFTNEDGSMSSGTYEDLTVQGVGFRGPDFFNQVVLANGTLDDGLIMLWRYDVNDDFTDIEFYKSSGNVWTSVGTHSI